LPEKPTMSFRLFPWATPALLALESTRYPGGSSAEAMSVRETEALVKKIKSFGRSAPKIKGKSEADPELVHLAGELKRALGTQVKISARGKGGKIEISYYSPQDLDRLLEVLGIS
jgi:ParB family chromosome partitioning protein